MTEQIKIGIFTPPDPDMSNLEGVRQVAAARLPGFELFAGHELAAPDIEAGMRIRAEAEKLGVALPCLSMMADMTGEGEADRLTRYVDLAQAMGVGKLHHTIFPSLSLQAAQAPFEELLAVILPRVRQVYDYGARRGVQCVYEDQGFQFNGCRNFGLFLEKLDRPAGVVLDLGNIAFVGEQADQFAARFAQRIVHVHAKDYAVLDHAVPKAYSLPGGRYLSETPIGAGDMRLAESVKILHAQNYTGWYMLECDPISDPYAEQIKNYKALEKILRGV